MSIDYLKGRLLRPNKKDVGNRIKDIKEEWNVSLTEMGKRLGIKKSTMNSYVQGYYLPPIDIIEKLFEITGKPVLWFYYGYSYEYILSYLLLTRHSDYSHFSIDSKNFFSGFYTMWLLISGDKFEYPNEDFIDKWFVRFDDTIHFNEIFMRNRLNLERGNEND